MDNTKRQTVYTLTAFLIGCIIAAASGNNAANSITEPLAAFGQWLRNLSLSGTAGNIEAWAITIGISCLPALGLLWKKHSRIDWLLAIGGAETFAMLYYLVNPTRVSDMLYWANSETIAKMWALVSAGSVAATLLCWALLRFIKTLIKKPAEILPVFLFWTAAGYALLLGFSAVRGGMDAAFSMQEGNNQQTLMQTNYTMLIVLQVISYLPDLMGVWVMLLAGKLALALETEPFAETTVSLAEEISKKSILVAEISLLLTAAGNLLQLMFFSKLLHIYIKIHVPLLTLVMCAVLMLLCKYFRRAKEVNDDNASII